MSEYIMDPGARLEIGPGGKPYESLGACCAGCASGKKTCGKQGLGALSFSAQAAAAPMMTWAAATPSQIAAAASPTGAPSVVPYVVAAGVGLIGLVVYLRRRKNPRRR